MVVTTEPAGSVSLSGDALWDWGLRPDAGSGYTAPSVNSVTHEMNAGAR